MAGKKRGAGVQSGSSGQPLTVQRLLRKAFSQTGTIIFGETLQASILEISFEEFKNTADSIQGGRVFSVYTDADRACMSFFFPASVIDACMSVNAALSSAGNEDTTTAVLRSIMGNLPYICAFLEEEEGRQTFIQPEPYGKESKGKLYWTISECSIFQVSIKGVIFFIAFPVTNIKRIEDGLNGDAAFLDLLRREILSTDIPKEEVYTKRAEGPIRIVIEKPLEFLLGNCFLPRQAFVGKKNVSVVFKEFTAGFSGDEYISDGLIWFRFWVEAEEKIFSVYYSVDVKGRIGEYKTFFEKLFKELVKYSAKFLRKETGFNRAGGSIVKAPDKKVLGDSILFNTIINLETSQISCRIFVGIPFFTDYLIKLLEPWQVGFLEKYDTAAVLSVLSINSALFEKNVETFYRQSSFLQSGPAELTLAVSEIIAILNSEDSRRLIQNYFLANGWSLDKIQSLFLYKYYAEEDVKPKIARDVLFDKEEYRKYFPPAQRDDWRECKGVADSYEQLMSLNKEALEGIFSAMKQDRLVLPYKAFYMLHNEFQRPLDEQYTKKIDALLTANSIIDFLPDIPRNRGQQTISSIPNGKLSLALLFGTPAIKDLAPFISKTKRKELEEEIRVQKGRYEKGEITAEKIYNEMNEFIETVEQLAVPEDEAVQ